MTRINCVPVGTLSDKHLGAEYRELPRIYGLVRATIARGATPANYAHHTHYTLGKGHCLFFYTRLAWLDQRFREIARECDGRGRRVSFPAPPSIGIPEAWFGWWEPTEEALRVNAQRIAERTRAII